MTSKQLAALLSGYRETEGKKYQFDPEHIYYAGTFAQEDILSEAKLLHGTSRLALVTGQELYCFVPVLVAGAIVTPGGTTVRLVTAGHVFHTGDQVVVNGVLGTTEANGRWTATCPDQTNIDLDGSTFANAWISGGTVYHALAGVLEIKNGGIRKVSSAGTALTGTISKRSKAELELYREEFGVSSGASEVIYYCEEYTNPLTLWLQGVPSVDILTEVSYFRRPIPDVENLSDTVNPILPAQYDAVLIAATKYFMWLFQDGKEAQEEMTRALQAYQFILARRLGIHRRAKKIPEDNLTESRI